MNSEEVQTNLEAAVTKKNQAKNRGDLYSHCDSRQEQKTINPQKKQQNAELLQCNNKMYAPYWRRKKTKEMDSKRACMLYSVDKDFKVAIKGCLKILRKMWSEWVLMSEHIDNMKKWKL